MGVGKRPTVAELFRAHAAEKAAEEWRGEWAAALLYRPIGLVLAAGAIRLSIGATAITLTALAVALALPALALCPATSAAWLIGAVALAIPILDCVDGTVARATGTASKAGHYLDFCTDLVFRLCFYGAIGILAASHRASPAGLESWIFGLSLLAAALAILARLCRVYAERFAAPLTHRDDEGGASLLFSVVSGIDHLLPFFVIAAGFWNGLGWVVLWLLLYSVLDFLHTQFSVLSQLR